MALRARKQMFHKCKCLETASIWGRHWGRGVAQTAYKMNINELQERKKKTTQRNTIKLKLQQQ